MDNLRGDIGDPSSFLADGFSGQAADGAADGSYNFAAISDGSYSFVGMSGMSDASNQHRNLNLKEGSRNQNNSSSGILDKNGKLAGGTDINDIFGPPRGNSATTATTSATGGGTVTTTSYGSLSNSDSNFPQSVNLSTSINNQSANHPLNNTLGGGNNTASSSINSSLNSINSSSLNSSTSNLQHRSSNSSVANIRRLLANKGIGSIGSESNDSGNFGGGGGSGNNTLNLGNVDVGDDLNANEMDAHLEARKESRRELLESFSRGEFKDSRANGNGGANSALNQTTRIGGHHSAKGGANLRLNQTARLNKTMTEREGKLLICG